jgi:glycopeptide antibiotics resistance protein
VLNLAGNIIAFMPMGFLLPIVFKRLNKFQNTVLVSLFFTVLIEVSQYILAVGVSDIDDVILNLAGAVIGYLIYIFIADIFTVINNSAFRK